MPKSKTFYYCHICRRQFEKEQNAEECENNHLVPQKIVKYDYDKDHNRKIEYPASISIAMENAEGKKKIVEYYRKP